MIIVGAGGIGWSLVEIATREGNNVVIIESDKEKADAISRKYDIMVLNTDANSAEVLQDAGAEKADALVATTSDDATNLMITSLGNELEIPSLVSVVNDKTHAELFRKLGANVMENPDEIVAEYLYNAVKRPKIRDFITLSGGAQVFKATVTERSPLLDKTLEKVGKSGHLPQSTLIIAIERGGELVIPTGKTEVKSGDLITVFSKQWASDEEVKKLTG